MLIHHVDDLLERLLRLVKDVVVLVRLELSLRACIVDISFLATRPSQRLRLLLLDRLRIAF